MAIMERSEVLTAEGASRWLARRGARFTPETLKWHARRGQIAYSRPGRRLFFTPADLEVFLSRRRVEVREAS